jgi:hypothetical protein
MQTVRIPGGVCGNGNGATNMWTKNLTAKKILANGLMCCVVTAVSALAIGWATPSSAVEYVKICSLYGEGYFYIPGSDNCVNANQINASQFAIGRDLARMETGVALAGSLVTPFLPENTNYAISTHWANFEGKDALGVAGLIRLQGNLMLSGGVAAGLNQGGVVANDLFQTDSGTQSPSVHWSEINVLTRVGFEYAW